MRTVSPILLFVLALAPLRAAEPALTAPKACEALEAQALKLTAEKVRCEAGPEGLILRDISPAGLKALQKDLIVERRYLGHLVVLENAQTPAGPSPVIAAMMAIQIKAAEARLQDSPAAAQASVVNFDNSVTRMNRAEGKDALASGAQSETLADAVADIPLVKADMASGKNAKFVLVQQGPPGSGGGPPGSGNGPPGSGRDPGARDPQQQDPHRGGPPGSGGRDPQRGGPPGSGNPPGGQNPPGGSTPPSRPAPVWRSNFPAPAPNWWNTDFNGYDWWTGLPNGYDRSYRDESNPDSLYIYSGWYRWRDVFVTNWERTEDAAAIRRTPANQGQIQSVSLTSQVYREAKECYYQAVYRYDWVQGGFYGSHWEEHFDRYKARCIRLPRDYGQPRVYTSHVSFDMGMVSGQDLPWESDVIRITYDGTGTPRYDFSGAAYSYSPRLDGQRQGSESVTLIAGAKVLRAPESDKVQAFLRNNGGKIEFVINDDRADYYRGETLRVNARVVRRVVIKVKGMLWGWNEKNVDSLILSSPVDVVVGPSNPQGVTDLTGAASAPKPANAVRSIVFIESWEFVRVNSRISTGAVIRKGQGNAIAN
ncbi:MAG: hypothetical protein PHS14_17625 [Elusimicrobia bacterium]|nr:hypothetical protein [Elusimicrobiota bacterium]